MDVDMLSGSINPINAIQCWKYKHKFRKEHPEYFDPERPSCILRWAG